MTQRYIHTGRLNALFMRFLGWRERHIPERRFVLILAFFVGIAGGLAAQLLKWLIHEISGMLRGPATGGYGYILLPTIGVVLAAIYVRYVVKDKISHGVTRVLWAISQNKSRLKRHSMYSALTASSVTIGFGGSVGAEGPIVYTGAAIGSNMGSLFRMSPRTLMILIGCGAAAGIAGIFKAPIAGLLFALEVLMIDLTTVSVMPLMISAVTSATIAYIYTGYTYEFFFVQSEDFSIGKLPAVIVLGVLTGLVSWYFTKVMTGMEGFFGRFRHRWVRTVVGCVILSGLVFLFPPLYGEGYEGIGELLSGNPRVIMEGSVFGGMGEGVWVLGVYVGMIVLMKGFATSATTGAGGVGGTFAPSLFVGCMTGFLFAYVMNEMGIGPELSTKNFALIGMAGVMSGVMHAPLMAIFLTAELTGGYELFLPLLVVSMTGYGTIKMFSRYSIYAMRLGKEGKLLTHEKDKAVLMLMKADAMIETDFIPVRAEMSLKEMVEVISRSTRNLYPVLTGSGELLGVVMLDDIRNIMFRTDLYGKMNVGSFMTTPPERIMVGEDMGEVMKKFDRSGAWVLPVVDRRGYYYGFISKGRVFTTYRRVLRHYCDD